MGIITLKNVRASSDITVNLRLKDGGMYIAWTSLTDIKAYVFSDAQRAIAGRCEISIDGNDNTVLVCTYSATKPQYLGVNSIVVRAKYDGRVKTYDRPAFNIVPRTFSSAGDVTLDDPTVDLELVVADVSSSLLDMAIALAFKAVDEWDKATITQRGPDGKSAYDVAVDNGFVGTEDEWLETLVGPEGPRGKTGPAGVTSAEVIVDESTGEPHGEITIINGLLRLVLSGIKGEPGQTGATGEVGPIGPIGPVGPAGPVGVSSAVVSVGSSSGKPSANASLQNGVLRIDFDGLKGQTGEPGPEGPTGPRGEEGERGPAGVTSVVIRVNDTSGTPSASASINNGVLTIILDGIKGEQGNTGVSVDFPITIVNNRYEGGADKAWSAEQGKLLSEEVDVSEYVGITPLSVTPETRVNPDGTIEGNHNTVSVYKYAVTGGKECAFSAHMSKNFTLYVLFWYDSEDNFISKENYRGSSSQVTDYDQQTVTAPVNAAYARMNVQTIFADRAKFYSYAKILMRDIYEMAVMKDDVVDSLSSTSTDDPLAANQGRLLKEHIDASVAEVKDVLTHSTIESLAPDQTENGGYYSTDGTFIEGTYYKVQGYNVENGKRYMFSGTMPETVTVNFVTFWGEDDTFLSAAPYKGSMSADVTYVDQMLALPEGTTQIKLNIPVINASTFALKSVEDEGYYDLGEMDENINDLEGRVATIEDEIDETGAGEFIYKVIGKNLINKDDLLTGWTWSADNEYFQRPEGIMSNKLVLSPGTYTIQGVRAYAVDTARICWFDDRDRFIRADKINIDANDVGTYQVKCTSDFYYVRYARLVLQYGSNRPFNPAAAQFEKGSTATEFEACQVRKGPDPSFGKTPKHVLLSGASIGMVANGWFEDACERIGCTHHNVSVSGESIKDAANKLWRGTLFAEGEFENTDVVVLSHVHNQNVASENSTGILQSTVEEYEARCYNASGVLQEGVTPDPTNPSDYVIPLTSSKVTESYAAGFDYFLKKYAAMCYACKNDPNSRWYGTKSGKPFNVIICSYWHDARTVYNAAAKTLCERHGALFCDFAGQVGFSYHQTDPTDPNSIRQSALYCNNAAYGGGSDTETLTIDGVQYTGMGWHPTRDPNSYLTKKLGKILSEKIEIATTDD